MATFLAGTQNLGQDIIQVLRNALNHTTLPDSTSYGNGEHLVCVGNTIPISLSIGSPFVSVMLGGGIPVGGIFAFPQSLPAGSTLILAQIKTLADDVLQHGCNTCGSVPIKFPNNQDVDIVGELTCNFVSQGKFECDGNCISGQSNSNTGSQNQGPSTITVSAITATTTTSCKSILFFVVYYSLLVGPATVTVIRNDARRLDVATLISVLVLQVLGFLYRAF